MIVDGYVDVAVIGRGLFILPGEVFSVYLNEEEVSRGHSRWDKKPGKKTGSIHAHRRTK